MHGEKWDKLKEVRGDMMKGLDNLKSLLPDKDLVDEMAMLIYTLNKISDGKEFLNEDDMLRLMKKYKAMLNIWIQFLEEKKGREGFN